MTAPRRASRPATAKRPARATTGAPHPTRERILVAAEQLLRRHGVDKLTVMDVARALEMSHANVYRHFASRTALHDALVERWLHQVSLPLAEIAERDGTATERLEAWVLSLVAAKRRKVLRDPELFAAYHAAAEAARDVVDAHLAVSRGYLERIVRDGMASGEFVIHDVGAALSAIRHAVGQFTDPHAIRRTADDTAAHATRDARRVVKLLIGGLRSGAL